MTSRKSPSSARLPDSHDVIVNLPSSPPPERSSSAATYVVDSPKTSPRRSASTLLKPITPSPKRKQWSSKVTRNVISISPAAPNRTTKMEKWWKNDQSDGETKRNIWMSSTRLKSIKSRKRRKKKMLKKC